MNNQLNTQIEIKDMQDPVIFFDGVCNLCNASINYVIDHDPKGYFKLCAIQSEKGEDFLKNYNLTPKEVKTVILFENNRLYTRSVAALKIAKRLKGPVKLTWIFILVPRFLRDPVYNYIARNRYRWFGKREQCRVPTPEIRNRFI